MTTRLLPWLAAINLELLATCDALPGMPLFLDPDAYVNVALEETHPAAWRGMPRRWRRVLEG